MDKIGQNHSKRLKNLKEIGQIVVLVKPHYEAESNMLRRGKLPDDFIPEVLDAVKNRLRGFGIEILGEAESPILGSKGKNKEFLFHLKKLD